MNHQIRSALCGWVAIVCGTVKAKKTEQVVTIAGTDAPNRIIRFRGRWIDSHRCLSAGQVNRKYHANQQVVYHSLVWVFNYFNYYCG